MKAHSKTSTGYNLSRQWFDFVFENPQIITPVHAALWFWLVELNNRLNWKPEFGVPTDRAMVAIGTKSFNTYKKAMNDLIEWDFVRLISKSKNQHTANIYSLVDFSQNSKVASSKFDEADKVASSVGTSNFDTSLTKQTGLLHQNLTPHNDIDKQNKPFPNDLNPKGGDFEFLNKVINEFKEAFEEKTDLQYIITDEKRESYGASKIAELYKRTMNITDDQELLEQLKGYFKTICSTKDPFLRKNLNLTYISNNINAFNLSLKSLKKKELSQEEKASMAQYLKM